MKDIVEYTILDRIGILTANFTAAVTNVITSASHGLKNGDMIVLTTTGTLPAGLETDTVYYVRDATTNTFKVALTPEEPEVDITDTGTGTHTFTMHDIGKSIFVGDLKHVELSIDTAGNAAMTIKVQTSIAEDCPDFSAAQAYDNSWDYAQMVDLEDGSPIDGDTGITFTGTDDHRHVEVNINMQRWLNVIISDWTAGTVTVKLMGRED